MVGAERDSVPADLRQSVSAGLRRLQQKILGPVSWLPLEDNETGGYFMAEAALRFQYGGRVTSWTAAGVVSHASCYRVTSRHWRVQIGVVATVSAALRNGASQAARGLQLYTESESESGARYHRP